MSYRYCLSLFFGAFILLSGTITASYGQTDDAETNAALNILPLSSLSPILKDVVPTVVNVAVQGDLPPFRRFYDENNEDGPIFGPEIPRRFESLGSGVVIDSEKGYLITSAHVVQSADLITITLHDGTRLNGEILGTDPETDIAVIQVNTDNVDLPSIEIGDSDDLNVGDFVVAIGNPYGLNTSGRGQTATFGMVSALGRTDINVDGLENYIQTDAAINPGNSGGPLLDLNGKLVGINTAIVAPIKGNVGIGFAIPSNMAMQVYDQLVEFGSIRRGVIGIFVQPLTPEIANALGMSDIEGALVTQVTPGSPAEQAGLQASDIITAINGNPISYAPQVKSIVGLLRSGTKINMNIIHNGEEQTVQATIVDIKKQEEELQARNQYLFGIALRDYSEVSPTQGLIKGVQVLGATENSPGWIAGIRPGDIIINANNQEVNSTDDLQRISGQTKEQLLLHVIREPGALFLVIK